MKLTVKKVAGHHSVGFVPVDRAAELVAEKLPAGRRLRADIVRPRSRDHNGLMFAIFTLMAKVLNDGPGEKEWDQDSVRKRLLVILGYADFFDLPKSTRDVYGIPEGAVPFGFLPKSMNFDTMEQDEACRFFNRALAYVVNEWGDWVYDHPDWTEIERLGRDLRETEAA